MTRKPHPAPTDRSRVRRMHEKAAYDRESIDAILDAMPVAHVGYVLDGAPVVTPTLQWREGDRVYWHGSAASRMMKVAAGLPVCLTVTLVDGMVLARSGLEHSVNYRSVMLFGTAEWVQDPVSKSRHLQAMFDAIFPGRWETLRPMKASEVKATAILSIAITEASAKLAHGMPSDVTADLDWAAWSGVIPTGLSTGIPVSDPMNHSGLPVPDHVARWRFGQKP
jgi:nitroimidazol reductase NimA-like FMN-containing flavoprotein (pyridoxamine 5'-phosphate oxidase superfamily)